MSIYGRNDTANNAPKQKNIIATVKANGSVCFANTTESAFLTNAVVGLYAVDIADHTVNQAHPGWILERSFTGPVSSLTVNAIGTGYSNSDTITVSNGTINATANIVTFANGSIANVIISNVGQGFVNNSITNVHITTSTGSGATLVLTLGGRANRKTYETLYAFSSVSGNTYEPS